jgi:hypothetical protein
MKTRAKVHLYTFPKGQTSGSCIPVATVNAEIEFIEQQVCDAGGTCFSRELKPQEVPVINIQGRRFICDKSSTFPDAQYVVAIPQDLAATLKTSCCPACMELIPQSPVTRNTIAPDALRVYAFKHRSGYVYNGKAYRSLDSIRRTLLDNQRVNIYVEEADEYTTGRFLLSEIERGVIKFVD